MEFFDNDAKPLADELKRRLKLAKWASFAVAFIQESGVEILEDAIRDFVWRHGKLRVLFGNAFGITHAKAIQRLRRLGADLRYHAGPSCRELSVQNQPLLSSKWGNNHKGRSAF